MNNTTICEAMQDFITHLILPPTCHSVSSLFLTHCISYSPSPNCSPALFKYGLFVLK